MTLVDLFGIGLALSLIGGLAVAFELSPLARTRFADEWIYEGLPRRASQVLSWAVLGAGHLSLVVAAVWWLSVR